MRREYQSFAAAREIDEVVRRLSALPGRVEYVAVDVTNPADVDRAVAGVVSKYGRIDLVMHGAGVQTSTRLENRKLDDFRRTIDTKIGGLRVIPLRPGAGGPPAIHELAIGSKPRRYAISVTGRSSASVQSGARCPPERSRTTEGHPQLHSLAESMLSF